jgi:RNA polymerase sigma-70 factor, ECF subfamily
VAVIEQMQRVLRTRRNVAGAGPVPTIIANRAGHEHHTDGSTPLAHGTSVATRPTGRACVARKSSDPSPLEKSLQQMAQGDHVALGACYDLIGGVVFSLAVRMLRDRQAAEDVVQDIFTQVWQKAATFDATRGSAEAWILMIARSRVLDRLRSRAAGVQVRPMGDNLPEEPDAEDWPDDLAISREQAATVRTALFTLPAEQRKLIEMAFFDGRTHVEIADQLGVPLGTVKTRIRLGLMRIREVLAGVLGEETQN